MKRKNILALVTLLAVLVMALAGCGSDSDRIAELEAENAELRSQIEGLTAQLENMGQSVLGLASWELSATSWSSANGASVNLTAIPLNYSEGQSATFSIWLEGAEVENVPCEWNGQAYTAMADLNAADGYCYYVILIAPDGTQTEVDVNTPIHAVDTNLINLESALNSYCNLMVEDAQTQDGKLNITSGYVQVQLPQLTMTGEAVSCTTADIILQFNGEEVGRQTVTLAPSEAEFCYEASASGVTFDIPSMEDDQQLDLWVEAVLSDGQVLSAPGGSWFYSGGELFLAVG